MASSRSHPSHRPGEGPRAARRRWHRVAACLAALLAGGPALAQQAWQFTPLPGFLPVDIDETGRIVGYAGTSGAPATWTAGTVSPLPVASGSSGYVGGLNGSGTVVGFMQLATGRDKAVTWSGGARTGLRTLGGDSGRAWGVTADDRVVGESQRADGSWHATMWVAGLPVRLRDPADTDWAVAFGMNTTGTAVGMSHYPARGTFGAQATAWVDGRPRSLKTLGGESSATGINEAGTIIGFGYLPDNNHARALVWSSAWASPVQLAHLAGDSSFAEDVNASGTVVGRSFTVDTQIGQHGVMWVGTQVTDLSVYVPADLAAAGWYVRDATGINDAGAIVGRMCVDLPPPGACQGFLLTPG